MEQEAKRNDLVVKRSVAIDTYGAPIVSEMGKQIYNYEVFGTLMGKTVRVSLDVVVRSISKDRTESKSEAFELLDLVFDGSDTLDSIVVKPVDASFIDANGRKIERMNFVLCALEPDTGFELELPIKPRTTTDNTKLSNLVRRNEWLANKAKQEKK